MADEDKPGDPLSRAAERLAYALRISTPAGHPSGDITKRVRREQQVHARRAARELLLPHRDLVIRDRGRDEHDELPRVMGELVLLFEMRIGGVGILCRQGLTQHGLERAALVL